MRKIIVTYGLISGAIVSGLMFATMPLWESGTLNFDNGELVGYTTMVIALSMVFFGIKSYRDNYSNGSISFWQGVKIGILITLLASVMYALAWEICYHTLATDFTEKMSQHYLEKMKREAASETEIKAAVDQMKSFKEWYKNPLLRFGVTLAEILPVGIVITLLSSGLLQKKQIFPIRSSN